MNALVGLRYAKAAISPKLPLAIGDPIERQSGKFRRGDRTPVVECLLPFLNRDQAIRGLRLRAASGSRLAWRSPGSVSGSNSGLLYGELKVGAANAGVGDPHDGVVRVDNGGVLIMR